MTNLIFYTPTILPKACLFTMGVSVKETENPIGFFGTGLKYAIAVILRLNGDIKILSNLNDKDADLYTFHIEQETIRHKEFNIIICDDGSSAQRMPMTTDYGKNWQPWMALRELYSNTIDEGGEIWLEDAAPTPRDRPGTYITVDCEEVLEAWIVRHKTWLLDTKRRTPVWSDDHIEVYLQSSNALFYRGIRVSRDDFKSALTYNIKRLYGSLTEDRTYDPWNFNYHFSKHLIKLSARDAAAKLLEATANPQFVESGFYLSTIHESGSIQMQEEALRLHRVNPDLLSGSVKDSVNNYLRVHEFHDFYKVVKLSDEQRGKVSHCFRLLEPYIPIHKYKIHWCANLEGKMGIADFGTKTIILDVRETLDKEDWEEHTVTTIMEEFIHLRYQVMDYTRSFQDAVLKLAYQIITTKEVEENAS